MAGRGPAPKRPETRQRKNRTTTAASIDAKPAKRRPPALPRGGGGGKRGAWHEQTRAWWKDLWRSPLEPEYVVGVDDHLLLVLAAVLDRFWHEPSKELATEVRLQAREFGLNPMARRSLQWQVKSAAAKPGEPARRTAAKPSGDPRERLKLVK